jgi:hypothetical protein
MICVKSYSGPKAKAHAEEMAKEIRDAYRVPAYLFEKGADERKKQEEFVARERERQKALQQMFLAEAGRFRLEAEKQNRDFLDSTPPLKVRRYQTIEDQWAVLVGGWKDMETARKELNKVRTWQPPKNKDLLDVAVTSQVRENGEVGGNGSRDFEVKAINPFEQAMVFPNPLAPKVDTDDGTVKMIYKLNEKEELSVLRIKKPWTMVVKAFHPPYKVRDYKGEKSLLERTFSRDEAGRELQATALQAVAMAKALRDPDFKPHPFDAYVLHNVYGSLVCVGQFDSPSDPMMVETQRVLDGIRFTVGRQDQFNPQQNVRLFDPMFALQIPKNK